jgi:hypothetical protein
MKTTDPIRPLHSVCALATILCACAISVYADHQLNCNGNCEPDGCSCCCKQVNCFWFNECRYIEPKSCFNDCVHYINDFRSNITDPPVFPQVCKAAEGKEYTVYSTNEDCEYLCESCFEGAERQNCVQGEPQDIPVQLNRCEDTGA